jgi:phosphoribosyl 1,2-cyclic phosphodiesterase
VFHFRSLASGSSGNAFLLKTDKASVLFDAGLRLSALERYLADEGVAPSRLSAILLSHEHRDHAAAARDFAEEHGVPVCANYPTLKAAGLCGLPTASVLEVGQCTSFGDIQVATFPVSHDAAAPVGFEVRVSQRTITIATDLGKPTPGLQEALSRSDLVVLEANHDPDMLRNGRYPPHLQRRVAGPTGHLANLQAADIVARHVGSDQIELWLAHLSRNNNTISLATATVKRFLRAAGLGSVGVMVARRDRPSLAWSGLGRPTQLSLFTAIEAP